uniref:UPF0667 protein C1orf55 n=1 Tax=Aceria tosichella TaxID=561515 RepID=A0A6G1SLZ8_9ACAR
MATTNIFYRLPSQRGTRIASIAGTQCTLDQFCKYIIDFEGLNRQDFIIASGTKVFKLSSCSLQTISLQNNSHVDILIPLLGGKGGFGSLLRAIGAQIEKTTNRDACRDLSGRRLRDIKREDELRKLLELKARLEEEKRQRKKEKLEKLKKQSEKSKTSASIQELVSMFDDHAFNKRRLELSEILDAAVEKGLINAKKRASGESDESNKKLRLEPVTDSNQETENHSELKLTTNESNHEPAYSKCETTTPSRGDSSGQKLGSKKKQTKIHNLWLGFEDDDEEPKDEEEDDDDEEEVRCRNKTAAVQR